MKESSLNIRTVVGVIGRLLIMEAILLLFPLIICIIYGETDWFGFAVASAAAGAVGFAAYYCTGHSSPRIRMREGFMITVLIWLFFGLFGLIPFMLGDHPLNFTDGMVEIISGFTTTGITVYPDVEVLSHGILFWRAFSQWLGGLGIVMFVLAILPELNKDAGISMYNAEATGITHDKLHPRIRQTVQSLWIVYSVITVVSALLLWAGPMSLFDSVCHSFTAVATGGFSTRNAGPMAWESPYILVVLTLEMFVAGLNFMLLYNVRRNGLRSLLKNPVFCDFSKWVAGCYLLMVVYALVTTTWGSPLELWLDRLFLTVSAATSTGYGAPTMESWGSFPYLIILLLMLCGACAGSTTGGIKRDRILIMCKNLKNEIISTVYRKRVYVVSLDGSILGTSQIGRISAFVALYFIVIIISTGICCFNGYSFSDSIFMVTSCIGTNGLGYGVTGAEGSYASLFCDVKWALVFTMLIGRLELFAFLTLFIPSFWKR